MDDSASCLNPFFRVVHPQYQEDMTVETEVQENRNRNKHINQEEMTVISVHTTNRAISY